MKKTIIKITQVKYMTGYILQIFFSDGKIKIINFENFIIKSKNPMTQKYKSLIAFKSFKLEFGDLLWGDYEMCFPIWDLYKGKI